MNKEGMTPVCKVVWTQLHKPNDKGFYELSVGMLPGENDDQKKWLGGIKEMVKKELTGPAPKPPYWQYKDNPSEFRFRFTTKMDVKWHDADGVEIEAPHRLERGTEIQVMYKLGVGKGGNYLNGYLNGIKIVNIPSKSAFPVAGGDDDWEDVPF